MDYEKLYKESLERARAINSGEDVDVSAGTTICEYIFPELAESEDERVRKELVAFLEELSKLGKDTNFDRWKTSDCVNWIAWLEKQCEQKPFDYENANIPQRDFAPKVEPKFKVKDFIKHNKANIICKVISVNSNSYYVENIETNGRIELFNAEQNFHLWTISDAKDGDVLVGGNKDDVILIFRGIGNEEWTDVIDYYCRYDCYLEEFIVQEDLEFCGYVKDNQLKPATKEQRDLLFQKMKETGYMWDAEKKELKKI